MFKFKKLNENFPIYICENFKILSDIELEHIKQCVYKVKDIDRSTGNMNAYLPADKLGILTQIYKMFRQSAVQNFNATIDDKKTIEEYWAYCTNRHNIYYVFHNHIKTSTINSVYYVNVPDCPGGELDFELNGKFYSFKPKQFDLIIMPNYLNHAPRQPLTDEYRISINLELFCKESAEEIFSKL